MLAGLFLVSCQTKVTPPSGPRPEPFPPPPAEEAVPSRPPPAEDPARKRGQAAAALTERGRQLMVNGQVDPAMRLFEQALSLAPQYGPGYYYLAEAWLTKDNWSQAREFHRQAALYLEQDGAWRARMVQQRRRIDRAAGLAF
jgi:tetratricopeptide (TPR) repeat protein